MNSKIRIKGCRQHNLKGLSLSLPKNSLVVFTGVSGSGKSSLAFDTIFAEGQRRYLESLSPQARLWVRQLPKAEVDLIEGLSPTLAIDQKRSRALQRGTVSQQTDLIHFLGLLFSHLGKQYSPLTGKRLHCHTRQEITEYLLRHHKDEDRLQILSPISFEEEGAKEAVLRLQKMGFVRFRVNGEACEVEEIHPDHIEDLVVVVDRLQIKEGIRSRLHSSVETAMDLGRGRVMIQEGRDGPSHFFSEVYFCPESGLRFPRLGPQEFYAHSPKGACPDCGGVGGRQRLQPNDFEWDEDSTVASQVEEWISRFPTQTQSLLLQIYAQLKVDVEASPEDLSPNFRNTLLMGSSKDFHVKSRIGGKLQNLKTQWKGLIPLFEEDFQRRKGRSPFLDLKGWKWEPCATCEGQGLKPEARACRIQDKNIVDLMDQPCSELLEEIRSWNYEGAEKQIADEILPEIVSRLEFLEEVGLPYLTLNRQLNTLSEGEGQRVHLAGHIGAKLSGILYVLDEPSLGLHKQDVSHLTRLILRLKELGNSIILVEHDASLIRQAEHLLELGPGSGNQGGEIVFQGSLAQMLKSKQSPTGSWLKKKLQANEGPQKHNSILELPSACTHNLKNIHLSLPLERLVGVCGVSGSGKSTLILAELAPRLQKALKGENCDLKGYEKLERTQVVHQQITGSSPRSMPATYVGIFTPLRRLLAETRIAKSRGYSAARFSLNKRGGRCEACEGMGFQRVSMQFMADLFVECEVCEGKRFNYETLQVTWQGKHLADLLELTAAEALPLFMHQKDIAPRLELMADLGLDYLTLGQPFNTLSGGEMQRLKLVSELAKKTQAPTLFLLDEPSRGLHFHDCEKLLAILHRLVEAKHSVIMIEHNPQMLLEADVLIELGPVGGPSGGHLLFQGSPHELCQSDTPTGRVLRDLI